MALPYYSPVVISEAAATVPAVRHEQQPGLRDV